MKIIHEFYGDAGGVSAVAVARPQTGPVDAPPRWIGASIDLLVTSATDEDALHIEGDLITVRTMLQRALEIVIVAERDAREETKDAIARAFRCPTCTCWYDPKMLPDAHPDGKGGRCDGATNL